MTSLHVDDLIAIGAHTQSGTIHWEWEEDDNGEYPVIAWLDVGGFAFSVILDYDSLAFCDQSRVCKLLREYLEESENEISKR